METEKPNPEPSKIVPLFSEKSEEHSRRCQTIMTVAFIVFAAALVWIAWKTVPRPA